MHILNRILVNVEEALEGKCDIDRSEVISMVRNYAEQETDCFYAIAYDWRETDTAGRWAAQYPENVLLGSEDPDQLCKEIAAAEISQKERLDSCLKILEEYASMPFSELVQTIWTRHVSLPVNATFAADMASTCFIIIAKLLTGEYFSNSLFYDTDKRTARINPYTYMKIQENPGDWALVFFDQHF